MVRVKKSDEQFLTENEIQRNLNFKKYHHGDIKLNSKNVRTGKRREQIHKD